MDNASNSENAANQVTFNYGRVMDMASCECGEVKNAVITDTYSTHDGDEDKALGDLDRMMTYMYEKRHGFVGFLSFSYAQMTMLYLLGKYSDAAKAVDTMVRGIEAVERYCFTGNYMDSEGKDSGFVNFSCGESAAELENTVRFSKDTYDTARLVHSKASSFESAYSLGTAAIMYHLSTGDVTAATDDCKNMRTVCEKIRKHIVEMSEKPQEEASASEKFTDYGNVEDLKNG